MSSHSGGMFRRSLKSFSFFASLVMCCEVFQSFMSAILRIVKGVEMCDGSSRPSRHPDNFPDILRALATQFGSDFILVCAMIASNA